MKIGNVEFFSKAEYMAGLRDSGRIELLKKQTDINNPAAAAALLRELKNQPFYFETAVGKEFMRELLRKTRPSDRGVGAGIRRSGYHATEKEEERIRAYEERRRTRLADSIRIIENDTAEYDRYRDFVHDEQEAIAGRRVLRNRNVTAVAEHEEKKTIIPASRDENRKKRRRKEQRRSILLLTGILSALLLGYCVTDEMSYRIQSFASEKKMEALQNSVLQRVETTEKEENTEPVMERVAMAGSDRLVLSDSVSRTEPVKKSDVLPEYEGLYEKNKDLIGWICIPGTKINYPVMQTKDEMEYYLYRDFDGKEDVNGLPFLDARCDIKKPSTNLLVYGHSMNSGAMFAGLADYKDYEFYQEHRKLYFDTIYERGEYEIVAVFQSRVAYVDEVTFRYYNFIQAGTEAEFESFISAVEKLSYYDTGVKAEFGDQLLTLSTCDREITDGRLVVLARKCND